MERDVETAYRELLAKIPANDHDLSARDKRKLRQPAIAAAPAHLFEWHLNQHTIFEDETDPSERRNGVMLRRVCVTEEGRLSEAQILAEEKRLGFRLPVPWRDVYRHFNGGWTVTLYWGDKDNPRQHDIVAHPTLNSEFLALQDVAPLRDFVRQDRPELETNAIDPRLIAISYYDGESFVLDYRRGETPAVGAVYISEYDDDPLANFEAEGVWWPDMRVFFRGLYIQDRMV